jgi:hypothetical protein
MAAGGGYFQGSLDMLLPLDIGQVGGGKDGRWFVLSSITLIFRGGYLSAKIAD